MAFNKRAGEAPRGRAQGLGAVKWHSSLLSHLGWTIYTTCLQLAEVLLVMIAHSDLVQVPDSERSFLLLT